MSTTVALDDDQQEIRDGARRFLENEYPIATVREIMEQGDDAAVDGWSAIAELGWAGIAVAEAQGGAGYGDVERVVLMEEMGRHLLPGPFFSSAVLAADVLEALAAAGSTAAQELLGRVIEGEVRATVVAGGDLLAAADPAGAVLRAGADDSSTVSGDGGLVVDGGTAEVFVVAARLPEGGTGVFGVQGDAGGITRTAAPLVDETRRAATVTFDGSAAQPLDAGVQDVEAALAHALRRSAVALAAEQVGGARQALDVTIAYLCDRQQYGVAIGTFQALKHRVADLGVAIDAARQSVLEAADALSGDDAEATTRAVSAAKAAASDAYVETGSAAIQLHGGIGFTQESDIGLYYKRAILDAAILGSSDLHRERIAVSLGL
jgi:alkylation response protein AidB-like acyl-CoA dehydrogenase